MRRFLQFLLVACILAPTVEAQPAPGNFFTYVTSDPTGVACTSGTSPVRIFNGSAYFCNAALGVGGTFALASSGAAPAGTLTGTTLAANVVNSSLTTLGAVGCTGTPDVSLEVRSTTGCAATPQAPSAGTLLHLTAANAANTAEAIDAIGGVGLLNFRRWDGTVASPSALQSGELIGAVSGSGRGATALGSNTGSVQFITTQIWTDAAQGTKLLFRTTPNNTVTLTDAFTIDQDQSVSAVAGYKFNGATKATLTAATGSIVNTETQIVGLSIPANTMVVGTTFHIHTGCNATTSTTPGNVTFRTRIGTSSLSGNIPSTVAAVSNASVTTQPFTVEAWVTVRTNGSGGTIIADISVKDDGAIATSAFANDIGSVSTATVAVDTTATKILELTAITGAASSSIVCQVAAIDIVRI